MSLNGCMNGTVDVDRCKIMEEGRRKSVASA